jgi:threonine dehydratase
MHTFSRADLTAAAARLRGHLVACPVIGDLCLPGWQLHSEVRLKAELLQPGGSMTFRGAQHWLLRQLGKRKGFVLHGDEDMVAVFARAAHCQRAPALALLAQDPSSSLRAALATAKVPFVVDGSDGAVCRATDHGPAAGFTPTPPVSDHDVALGVATVVLELADELPADTARLIVAPAALTAAVAAGTATLGLPWVVTAPQSIPAPACAALAEVLRDQHRLCTTREGASAVASALQAQGACCVVLGI